MIITKLYDFINIFYRKFKTWPGALTSILIIAAIIGYTVSRVSVMLSKLLTHIHIYTHTNNLFFPLDYDNNNTSVTNQLVDITQFDDPFQAR